MSRVPSWLSGSRGASGLNISPALSPGASSPFLCSCFSGIALKLSPLPSPESCLNPTNSWVIFNPECHLTGASFLTYTELVSEPFPHPCFPGEVSGTRDVGEFRWPSYLQFVSGLFSEKLPEAHSFSSIPACAWSRAWGQGPKG